MQLAAAGRRHNILHFTVFLQEKYLQCIRMSITIFILFIYGGITPAIRSEILHVAVKLNFRPYIRRYTQM